MSDVELVELYFEEVFVEETPGGARGFIDSEGHTVYIPLSLIKESETTEGCITVQVPVWFAEKEGLV